MSAERESFEKWIMKGQPDSLATRRKALYEGLSGWDEYESTHTTAMWRAWQARAAMPPCPTCKGSTYVITGLGENAGAEECPTCISAGGV